jgi:hypothetical protein
MTSARMHPKVETRMVSPRACVALSALNAVRVARSFLGNVLHKLKSKLESPAAVRPS